MILFVKYYIYYLRRARWCSLPHDLPKWTNVYNHYRIWTEKDNEGESIVYKVLKELVMSERVINGRWPKTSMSIVESKSIKNTDTVEKRLWWWGGISGIKLHLALDANGVAHVFLRNYCKLYRAWWFTLNDWIRQTELINLGIVLWGGGYTGWN